MQLATISGPIALRHNLSIALPNILLILYNINELTSMYLMIIQHFILRFLGFIIRYIQLYAFNKLHISIQLYNISHSASIASDI